MITPTEARNLADEWAADPGQLSHALRSLADQVEALQKDAERYRWLKNSGTAVSVWTDDTGTHWSVSTRDWSIERAELDAAIDRAREAP